MKILIVGNHTCSNLGDAAILRGLVAAVRDLLPNADLEITSRHPEQSARIVQLTLRDDVFYRWHLSDRNRLVRRFARWTLPLIMAAAVATQSRWLSMILPLHIRNEIDHLRQFDMILHVGGSFFVDVYGPVQFEYPFAAMLAHRPIHLVGHSMGPFGGWLYRLLARPLLENAAGVWLREEVSRELILRAGLPTTRLRRGSDTAWLAPHHVVREASSASSAPLPATGGRRIAVSFRDLGIFARGLLLTQAQYEKALAALIDELTGLGYEVVAISTCTSIPGYDYDDRAVAFRLRGLLMDASNFHIPEEEMNDIDLGVLLSSCELIVATRLHSAIIAMNSGTPAITLCYEHKTLGVMRQLGLGHLAYSMQSLLDGTFKSVVLEQLPRLIELREQVALAVGVERSSALGMIDRCINERDPGKGPTSLPFASHCIP